MPRIPRNPAVKKFSRKGWKILPKVKKTVRQSVVTPKLARKIAKSVMIKKTEQKYFDFNHGKVELNHNSYLISGVKINVTGNNQLPGQGDTDNARDGNKIYVSGVSIPMMLYTKVDNPNTKFRVICFRYAQSHNPFASYDSLFENISGNCMLDRVNPDLVTVLFEKIIGNGKYVSNQIADEITLFKKFWIPIKRTFTFRADNTQSYNSPSYHYGIVVVGFDTYGTVNDGTNVGAVQLWQRLYFKDL